MPAPTRPKRRWRVLAIAMAACAVLLVAAWVASTRRAFDVSWPMRGGKTASVWLAGGGLAILVEPTEGFRSGFYMGHPLSFGTASWWPRRHRSPGGGAWTLALPLWMPAAFCTIAACTCWGIDTHRRRLRTGLCPACGYDRAGLAVAATCPECGAAPAPPAAASR